MQRNFSEMKLSLTQACCSGTFLLLLVSNLLLWENVAATLQVQVSTKDLLEHTVFLTHYNHELASQAYFEFEAKFAKRSWYMDPKFRICHTDSILTPENRMQVHEAKNKDLLKIIISISLAWEEPLRFLVPAVAALEGASDDMLSSVKTMKERNQGIVKASKLFLRKTQPGAVEKDYVSWLGKNDLQSADEDVRGLALYNLFHCLRRDTLKVDSYLKVLMCRVLHNSNC